MMLEIIKKLSGNRKRAIMAVLDAMLLVLAGALALMVHPEVAQALIAQGKLWSMLAGMLTTMGLLLVLMRVPFVPLNAYEGWAVVNTAAFATCLGGGAIGVAAVLQAPVTSGVHLVFTVSFFSLTVLSRALLLQFVLALYKTHTPLRRVVIYGAGATGVQLAQALRYHGSIFPVAFVDDNSAVQGARLAGLTVHKPQSLPKLVRQHRVERVILAIPSESLPRQQQIARNLADMGLEVQIVPSFAQLVGAEETLVQSLKPVSPGSFLGRSEETAPLGEDGAVYTDRVVMITGAGGSIGSELARQVLSLHPKRLILYELSELALYTVEQELRLLLPEIPDLETVLVPVLGSVTEPRQVRQVLGAHGVEVILHAAAYKHVPLVEANPLPGLANNVLGTATLVQEAQAHGVARFILVSSDKAVRPVGVMGASKRMAELIVQAAAAKQEKDPHKGNMPATILSMVRFGNVLGSSGSVIPLFEAQIRRGGPVTVTHPRMERYFMTLQEATRLVLRAGAMARGGEVFVLDMGAPVSILKLARQTIEARGYTIRDADRPEGDIEITFTGLRPGEKLREELTITSDHAPTAHPKIFSAMEAGLSELETAAMLRQLREAIATADAQAARSVITRWVERATTQRPTPLPAVFLDADHPM